MQYLVQVGQYELRGSRPLPFMATSSAALEAHPKPVSRVKLGSVLLSCRVGSHIAPASPLPGAGPALLGPTHSGLADQGSCCDLRSIGGLAPDPAFTGPPGALSPLQGQR